ncbi:exoribonuclease II [Klebsiella pneumoniae subsp. rhinoscleromatis]|nr:exoribonuclease II [Klebsiella pneumoniae subsp. rhinoscleromatis]
MAKLLLTVAIADPTAWIAEGSKLDNAAKVRAFTNYLPGFQHSNAAARAVGRPLLPAR